MTSDNLIILDGGMGKYLWSMGLPKNMEIWSALALIDREHNNLVVDAHKAFLNAGCNVITTNNYACIPGYLKNIYSDTLILEYEIQRLTKLAVALANTARKEFQQRQRRHRHTQSSSQTTKAVRIAGSVPPLMESYRPDLLLSKTESVHYYSLIINSLLDNSNDGHNGVDIFLLETMSSFVEVEYILSCFQLLNFSRKRTQGNNNNSNSRFQNKEIWISFALQENGDLRSGESLNEVIHKLSGDGWLRAFPPKSIRCLSMNCCLPESANIALNALDAESIAILNAHQIFIGIYPNAFTSIKNNTWKLKEGKLLKMRDELTPKLYYNQFVHPWISNNHNGNGCRGNHRHHHHNSNSTRIIKASININNGNNNTNTVINSNANTSTYTIGMVGGCCGIMPNHIQYMAKQLKLLQYADSSNAAGDAHQRLALAKL